jgi:SNF2 family DNA or RNA helicase
MKDTLVASLDLIGDVHTAANAAVLSGKLSQITAGFLYSDRYQESGRLQPLHPQHPEANQDPYTWIHDEKINALREIVEGTGSPILVFYRFQAELEALTRAFPQAVNVKYPNAIPRWNRQEIPLMLAHPASAGHGLNLQHGGHTAVWTTLPWSLEEWQQANKRLARQGQRNPVVIHVLEAANTVDGAIWNRLELKHSVQHALLEHLELAA